MQIANTRAGGFPCSASLLAMSVLAGVAIGTTPCWKETDETACSKVVPDPAECFIVLSSPTCTSTVPAGYDYGCDQTAPYTATCVYARGTLRPDGSCAANTIISKPVNCRGCAGDANPCGGPLAEDIDPDNHS